jgi:serine/threonine protein kinase
LTVEKFESLYKKGRKIGDGAFGEVHLGYCIATGEKVAIKEIPHSVHRSKPNFSVSLLREISVCMAFPVHVSFYYLFLFLRGNSYIFFCVALYYTNQQGV